MHVFYGFEVVEVVVVEDMTALGCVDGTKVYFCRMLPIATSIAYRCVFTSTSCFRLQALDWEHVPTRMQYRYNL